MPRSTRGVRCVAERVYEVKQLEALDDENAKLKKLVAESMLDVPMLKSLLAKTADARLTVRCRDLGDGAEEIFKARTAGLLAMNERRSAAPAAVRTIWRCGSGFGRWQQSGGGSATGGCIFCGGRKASG